MEVSVQSETEHSVSAVVGEEFEMDQSTDRWATLEIAVGAAALGADLTVTVLHRAEVLIRPARAAWRHTPEPVGRIGDRIRADLSGRGRTAIAVVTRHADAVIGPLGRAAAESTLREMDLTALVREQVDMVALATEVVDGLDLSAIVRESTGSLASETVRGARKQAMHADDAVGNFTDRLFKRRHAPAGMPGPAFPGVVPT